MFTLLRWTRMKRIKCIIVLGIVACIFVFKSYFDHETNNIMYVAINLKRKLEELCWAMGIFRCFQQLLYRDYAYVIGEENPDTFYKLADENPNRGFNDNKRKRKIITKRVVWVTDGQHKQGRLLTFQSPGLNTPSSHPTPIVILTYMRSGSSLVGDVLQQHKDVFYLFEPLRLPQFAIRENKTYHSLNGDKRFYNSFLDAGQDIIRNWTICNLFDLPDVVWSDQFTSKSKKAKILKACRIFQSNLRPMNEILQYCVNMLRDVCFRSKYMVFKVIRFPVDKLEPLMAEFPSMKIIHLIRDPRATILSQMRFGIIKKISFVTDVIDFCSRVYRDIVTIDIFVNKFPDRILTYFYEDLARNPLDMSKSLYKFAGIQYTKEVEDFVYNITMAGKKSNCGNLCTIKSNSSAQADAWRLSLHLQQARVIDHACRPVYKRLGFKEIISEEMLLNNEIPLRLEPGQSYDYRFA